MKLKAFVVVALGVAACSGPQDAPEAADTPLGQARAIEVIQAAVAARDVGTTDTNIDATLSNGTEVNVDVFIRSIGAGYVYMTEQDRRDYGPIPEQSEGSELHAVLGNLTGGEQIYVLILQDQDYAHILNPRAGQRRPDEVTIDYVESRLRRDSRDFVQAIIDVRGRAASPE